MRNNPKTGLKALMRPEDSFVVLIDHQPFLFANLNSHQPTIIINAVTGLAKAAAKICNVPTILTTVVEERGGLIIKQLQDLYPNQKPINRTFINTWQDPNVTEIVAKKRLQATDHSWLVDRGVSSHASDPAVVEGYDRSGGLCLSDHDNKNAFKI
jgi:nicotinamidase-related amidase